MELRYAHMHPQYPEDWLSANHISGPMGSEQVKALRGLLKKGLVIRKRGGFANRYRRWLWRLSDAGFTEAIERHNEFLNRKEAKKKSALVSADGR